jgi:transcriptional regulator with XRE-family HTH domain
MTQMELADRMNISFQAVSAWERGQNMPDISKLAELSEIFGASIDGILGNERGAAVIKAIQAEQPVTEHLQADELEEIAPVLKPRQMDRVVREQRSGAVPYAVLPYLSSGMVTKIALDYYKEGNFNELIKIAPFIDADVLDDIIGDALKDGHDFGGLTRFFPFISQARLDEWAEKVFEETGDLKRIETAFPFLRNELIDKLALAVFERDGLAALQPIAPFVSGGYINDLAKQALLKDGLAGISPILPFIDTKIIEDYSAFRFHQK